MGVGPAEEVDGVWMSRDEGGLHENVGRETAMVAGPIVKVLLHGIPTKDASRTSEKKNRVVSSEAERGGAVGECGQVIERGRRQQGAPLGSDPERETGAGAAKESVSDAEIEEGVDFPALLELLYYWVATGGDLLSNTSAGALLKTQVRAVYEARCFAPHKCVGADIGDVLGSISLRLCGCHRWV